MSAFFSNMLAVLMIFPFLGYLIIFVCVKQTTKNHRIAKYIGIDFTTLLLIFSVHYLMIVIWSVSYLWLLFIMMFIIGIILVFFHWKTKKEIHIGKVLRGYWRMHFLVFSSVYFFLLLFGLIKKIVEGFANT